MRTPQTQRGEGSQTVLYPLPRDTSWMFISALSSKQGEFLDMWQPESFLKKTVKPCSSYWNVHLYKNSFSKILNAPFYSVYKEAILSTKNVCCKEAHISDAVHSSNITHSHLTAVPQSTLMKCPPRTFKSNLIFQLFLKKSLTLNI